MSASKVRPEPAEGATPTDVREPGRRKTLTRVLVEVIAVLVVLTVVLAILFTVPLVSTIRTAVEWSGGDVATDSLSPPEAQYQIAPSQFCEPSDAIGNLTLSVVWQSSIANTTAVFFWVTGGVSPVGHIIYWVNNTNMGGYSFPPRLSSFLCDSFNVIFCHWYAPSPGAEITVSVVRAYNYTTSQPIW